MNNIKANVSGTKNILFWQHNYSRNTKLSDKEFLEIQRTRFDDENSDEKKDGVLTFDGKTYTFSDQEAINNCLWKMSDTNKSGNLEEDEYNLLLAKTVSNGVIGDTSSSTYSGVVQAIPIGGTLGIGVGINTNEHTSLAPNYEQLLETCELYGMLKDADEGTDLNGDGVLSKEEFSNSLLTKLTTDAELFSEIKSNYVDSLSDEQKMEILSTLSDGSIADIYQRTVTKTSPVVSSSGTKISIAYGKETVVDPDYETLVDVAEKYNQIKKEEE